ncbi:hypothetical protein [Methylorubrum extorquens]|uniref:hypothetical protein n=1 Tax=Methylorubrum extorquens TaxID=408 RepID=UPI00209D72AE|nr:hypothetical protein [Methylorubrum extorquens]MCP1540097.1 hypothetical protein [Methylorubrum extorquens]
MSVIDRIRAAMEAQRDAERPPRVEFIPRAPDVELRAEKVAEDKIDLVIVHYPRRGPERRYELQWRPAERGDIAFGNPSMTMPLSVQRQLANIIVDEPIGTVFLGEHNKDDKGMPYFEWKRHSP